MAIGKVQVSSGWFDLTEPPRTSSNHSVKVESMPTGKVQVSSGWFDPNRTSLNHCVQVGSMPTGKVQVSSGWFDLLKPPRTTVFKWEACLQGRFK